MASTRYNELVVRKNSIKIVELRGQNVKKATYKAVSVQLQLLSEERRKLLASYNHIRRGSWELGGEIFIKENFRYTAHMQCYFVEIDNQALNIDNMWVYMLM